MFAILRTNDAGGGNNGRKDSGLGKPLKAFALASTIAVQFAASVFVGVWIGDYLDGKLGTRPWLMLAGLLTGIGAGMLGAYRTVSNILDKK
ncbi:AtpZ/AtpI family protein [Thermodesulfitimonas sp.]